jgi:hypothetical protein
MTEYPTPHVAAQIEPGAILYSSWGYDQTNIDFYMVTRCTKASAWIMPMTSRIAESAPGYSPMSEHVVAGDPIFFDRCECRHGINAHGPSGDTCHMYDCDCRELRPVAIKPAMHRIRREAYGEFLSLTSYSSASLWEGGKLYASHYA